MGSSNAKVKEPLINSESYTNNAMSLYREIVNQYSTWSEVLDDEIPQEDRDFSCILKSCDPKKVDFKLMKTNGKLSFHFIKDFEPVYSTDIRIDEKYADTLMFKGHLNDGYCFKLEMIPMRGQPITKDGINNLCMVKFYEFYDVEPLTYYLPRKLSVNGC